MPDLPLNFDAVCHHFKDLSITGFGGHIAISGCRTLLHSLADTFFELSVVVNPRFAVGISMVSLIVSEI